MSGSTGSSSVPSRWPVVITEWALDSYLNLKRQGVFNMQEYRTQIRPCVELLRDGFPSPHPQLAQNQLWCPATLNNAPLSCGFKMKWRNLGPGRIQLRLPVFLGSFQPDPNTSAQQAAFLCEAYVKSNTNYERRMLAKFKGHINLIAQNQYIHRGTL